MRKLMLRNVRCFTGAIGPVCPDCVVVEEGTFSFVGSEGQANVPADVEQIDCGGRLLVPGFVDGHAHLLNTGMAMSSVDLKGVPSVAAAVERVKERAEATPPGRWIRGAGWDQHAWPGTRFPNRQQLDVGTAGCPTVLTHTSGHCVWVNSAALRAAGITRETQSPIGGEIQSDEDGEPTGVLFDNAAELVYAAMPAVAQQDRIAALSEAIRDAQTLGVTGAHAMDVGRGELRALQTLHNQRELRFRTRAFLTARRLGDWVGSTRTGDGDDLLGIGGVKFFSDGALGSLTAWMLEPYEGSANVGFPLVPPDELEQQVRRCLTAGLAPAIHAIGDRANGQVLDILERTRSVSPSLPRRIEHAQLLRLEDVPRFGQLGVTASIQPIHATQDMGKVDSFWGQRGRGAYAFATLAAAGANLAFGSDSPVETIDPLSGLHAAVTRRSAEGEPQDGWYPAERLDLRQALTAYATGCARAVGEQSWLGRIGVGYRADAVLLSEDILALDDPMRILDARVDMTIVDGEIVYGRDDAW